MRNWLTVLPRRNMESRMKKLMHWLSAVARPAPPVPILNTKMKSGSSTMLSTPPVTRPIMAKLALPSYRRMLFITRLDIISGAANRMGRA